MEGLRVTLLRVESDEGGELVGHRLGLRLPQLPPELRVRWDSARGWLPADADPADWDGLLFEAPGDAIAWLTRDRRATLRRTKATIEGGAVWFPEASNDADVVTDLVRTARTLAVEDPAATLRALAREPDDLVRARAVAALVQGGRATEEELARWRSRGGPVSAAVAVSEGALPAELRPAEALVVAGLLPKGSTDPLLAWLEALEPDVPLPLWHRLSAAAAVCSDPRVAEAACGAALRSRRAEAADRAFALLAPPGRLDEAQVLRLFPHLSCQVEAAARLLALTGPCARCRRWTPPWPRAGP